MNRNEFRKQQAENRRTTLKEWEASRRTEVWIDWTFSVLFGGTGVLIAYSLLPAGTDHRLFLVCAGLLLWLMLTLVRWLRLWGAYVERRLIEIEALIGNVTPFYYARGDLVNYDENPLYEKLTEIQTELERISQRISQD